MSEAISSITVSRFALTDADAAFGLARLAFPDLTPARWRRLGKRWAAGRGGALLARDKAGRIVGFAPYETRSDVGPGKVLWVERVVAVSLVDSAPTVRALADGLTRVAQQLGCKRLKVETGVADRALRTALSRGPGAVLSTLVQATV